MVREAEFQAKVIHAIRQRLPDAIILKNDPNYLQGVPDLTIFNGPYWAWLDIKISENSNAQPNQTFYINLANEMQAYGAFIHPGNFGEVMHELQHALTFSW